MPFDFDLAAYRPAPDEAGDWRGCVSQDSSEIVVCGRRRRGGAYPFDEMERKFTKGPFVAETSIGGIATGRAHVEGVDLAPGMRSNRVMVGIKLPF
jgi:hypothetical protein